MTEPETQPVETPVEPQEQKPKPKAYSPSSPTFVEATDGLGWYLLIDGVADLVGSLLD